MDFNNQMKWYRGNNHKSVKTVYENNWFKIKNRDGFFSLEYGVPQVVVLPVIDTKKILFVKVKRPLINDNSLELPAGGSIIGETLRQTAARELREETGITINDLDRFYELPMLSELPGRSPELLSCFSIDISVEEYESRFDFDHEIAGLDLLEFNTIIEKIISGELYLSSPIAIVIRYLLKNHYLCLGDK